IPGGTTDPDGPFVHSIVQFSRRTHGYHYPSHSSLSPHGPSALSPLLTSGTQRYAQQSCTATFLLRFQTTCGRAVASARHTPPKGDQPASAHSDCGYDAPVWCRVDTVP